MEVLNYQYQVVKIYEIDKMQVLREGKVVLYPLRVIMKHEGEAEMDNSLGPKNVVKKEESHA